MKIHFYLQSIARVFTTGTPYRGMLRQLVKLRPNDEFVFSVLTQSSHGSFVSDLIEDIDQPNLSVETVDLNRRYVNLRTLVGHPVSIPIKSSADIYFTSDMDFLGDDCFPQVAHVADLSSVRRPDRSSLNWIGRRMRRVQLDFHARNKTHFTTISNFTKNDVLEFDSRFNDRLTVSVNGIEDEWFLSPKQCKTEIMKRFGLTGNFFVWWGLISPRKNIDGLIEAVRILKSRHGVDMPTMVIIGKFSPECRSLPQKIVEYGLSDCFKLLPFQDLETLRSLIHASSGLVFPSFYEGFGLPIVECIASKRPFAASDIGSIREFAGVGNGLFFDPSIPTEIAEKMEALLKFKIYEDRAIQWSSQFTHAANAKRYSELIDRLVNSKQEKC